MATRASVLGGEELGTWLGHRVTMPALFIDRCGWVGFVGWGKKKDKFISGEAGVISAGICWLIDPGPIAVLWEAGRPHVREGSGCLTMAEEIWVRAATSPRQPFGNQRSSCAPWLKHSPAKFPSQGALLHLPPSLEPEIGEKEGISNTSNAVRASPRSRMPTN